MKEIRDLSYKDIFGLGVILFFMGMFAGPGGMIIGGFIFVIAIVSKVAIDSSDIIQVQYEYLTTWIKLKANIERVSDKQFFDTLISLSNEIDNSHNPPYFGSVEKWRFLNQSPGIALKVYTIIASVNEGQLNPSKRKIKEIVPIGLAIIEGSFEYVLNVYKRITNRDKRASLGRMLIRVAHIAPPELLLIFLQEVIHNRHLVEQINRWKRFSYHVPITDLKNALVDRAGEFDNEQIKIIFDLLREADEESQSITTGESKNMTNCKMDFFSKRLDFFIKMVNQCTSDSTSGDPNFWYEKLAQSFVVLPDRYGDVYVGQLDANVHASYFYKGKILYLAIASEKLGDYERAITVLEYMLKWEMKDFDLPAIEQLIHIYELLGDREKARRVISRARLVIAKSPTLREKLREYDSSEHYF